MFKYFPTNYPGTSRSTSRSRWAPGSARSKRCARPLQEAAKAPDAAGTLAFRDAFVRMADKLCELADEDESRGRFLSAGEKLNRAADVSGTAERLQAHGAPGRLALYPRYRAVFDEGVRWPARTASASRSLTKAGTWRRSTCAPKASPGPAPMLVQVNGLDSTKEMKYRVGLPALAGEARRVFTGGGPAGHRRGAALARHDRPLRQRALGQPHRRLAGDAR